MKKITIWHTNDVHSQFEDFSAIVHHLRTHLNKEKDFLLDAGDFLRPEVGNDQWDSWYRGH